MSDTYALLFLIVNSLSVPLPFVIHEISTHKSHIYTLHHYFGIPLLQLWHEKNVNGPLRSVFTDCNSVLLTLDIQDEKGKQKTLGKSCETSFIYTLGVTRSILNGFFFESIVLAPISKFSVYTGSRFSTTKFSMCHYNQTWTFTVWIPKYRLLVLGL